MFYRPLVADIFAGDALELRVLTDEANVPIGFLGLAGNAIEALFLEPATSGEGVADAWSRTRRSFGVGH